MSELLTIGYEGWKIDDFVCRLKQFNVTRLIDVREIPHSRKAGFSKAALRERLERENIEYIHLKALGSPSHIRNKLKANSDYESFLKAYEKYLSKNMEAIKELYEFSLDGTNCIMCLEQLPYQCHRSVVANKVKEYDGNQVKVTHI